MTEIFREKLAGGGMDVDSAMERFMNSDAIMEKFLKKLLTDPTYGALIEAVNSKNNKDAFTAAHTLKGVAGNFSLTELMSSSSAACECFRAEKFDEGVKYIPAITESYEKIVQVIKEEFGE